MRSHNVIALRPRTDWVNPKEWKVLEFDLKEVVITVGSALAAVFGWAISGAIKVFFEKMSGNFDALTKSVQELNLNMARVLEKLDSHEKRIGKLEETKS